MIASLPACDRIVLQLAIYLVPATERSEWMRCWQGELWHRRHPRPHVASGAFDLYPGLLRDALWLRAESHRRALAGTALLCLLTLSMLVVLAALPLYKFTGNPRMLLGYLTTNVPRFLCEASLVTLVSFATAARFVEHSARISPASKIRGSIFQALKIALALIVTFLLSSDLTYALHTIHPFTAEIIQPQVFVVLALLALRWSFSDSEGRCKHCLRTLATPTRVGQPSRNFLDSNGTELLCNAGHGMLSVPEIETSWRKSSRWIAA